MALKTALKKIRTSLETIVQNPVESGVAIRISTLLICNGSSESEAKFDIKVVRDGAEFSIISRRTLGPGGDASVFPGKDVGIYLEEGDSIKASGDADNGLDVVCSYSELNPADEEESQK